MRRFVLLFFGMLFALSMRAEISGAVVDDVGMPIIGVKIVAETGEKTTTNFDGLFQLDVEPGVVIYLSLDGFKSHALYAQPYNLIVLQNKNSKIRHKAADPSMPQEMFVLLNGMSSFPFSPAIGVTFGMVREQGWYVNLMSGFGFKFAYAGMYSYGSDFLSNVRPFFTGESSQQFLSVTAGGVTHFGLSPVYMYYGGGYGFKSVTYKTNNDKWLAFVTYPYANYSPLHSVALETGLMCKIKGVAISAGYECLVGFGPYEIYGVSLSHHVKIGVGGIFKTQRR